MALGVGIGVGLRFLPTPWEGETPSDIPADALYSDDLADVLMADDGTTFLTQD